MNLTQGDGFVRLMVDDDGVGGDLVEGAGLSGMRARMAAIGGTVDCDGRRGTRLTLTAPLPQETSRDALVAS